MINTVSFTRLMVFESCPLRAKLQYADRIPDPNPSTAAERGTQIHTQAEEFVNGTLANETPPPTLKHFNEEFLSLRTSYKTGSVSLEGEWGFNKDWEPTPYKTAWLKVKADAVVQLTDSHVAVIDFKTGRKFGNEMKHGQQLELYSLAVFLRQPSVQTITSELWYLDQNDITSIEISRKTALTRYLKLYDRRMRAVTEAKKFPPTPSTLACKYCPYKPSGTGHCKVGL